VKTRIKNLEASTVDAKSRVTEADRSVESAELKVPCKWNEMYHRLAGYRYRVGHCLPLKRHAKDQEESELAEWCAEQRYSFANGPNPKTQRRRRSSSNSRSLSGEKGSLEKSEDGTKGSDDDDTDDGETDPEIDMDDDSMDVGNSCDEQHSSNNDPVPCLTPLEKMRRALLDRLGFIWDTQEALWQRFYRDLLDYKAIHGNCSVRGKHGEYAALAAWVGRQRTANRARLMLKAEVNGGEHEENREIQSSDTMDKESKARLKEGGIGISSQLLDCKKYQKCDALTDEQFRLLAEAGFDFNPYGNSWDRHYQELLEYKEQTW